MHSINYKLLFLSVRFCSSISLSRSFRTSELLGFYGEVVLVKMEELGEMQQEKVDNLSMLLKNYETEVIFILFIYIFFHIVSHSLTVFMNSVLKVIIMLSLRCFCRTINRDQDLNSVLICLYILLCTSVFCFVFLRYQIFFYLLKIFPGSSHIFSLSVYFYSMFIFSVFVPVFIFGIS